ncbi:MAG: DUF4349 domain-containing protein [Dehalococcoidales bacterium]|nr:DUF4349 domain-containing protein [Dehalococcoidales bacterium]
MMKRRLTIIIGLLLLVTLLVPAACASRTNVQSDTASTKGGIPTVAPQPATPPGFATSKESVVGNGGVTAVSDTRMIVRNGDMSLVVRSVIDARDQIVSLTERFEGFVVSSFVSGENEQMRGSITIRVPDDKFEQALSELRKLAVIVETDSTNSQDVTQQYSDLQARLKNAEATENQYLALLSQAKNVDETLRIYEALSRVRLEIEQIKGQVQYLERTSSMSLISIQLRPQGSGASLVKPGWSVLETIKSAIRSLVTLGQGLVNVLIWILLFLPVWGTILGVILWRIHRRRRMQP